MREVSGGIIGSACIIFFIGASGLLSVILKFISPITGIAEEGHDGPLCIKGAEHRVITQDPTLTVCCGHSGGKYRCGGTGSLHSR